MKGLARDLHAIIPALRVKTEPEDLLVYSSDATHYFKSNPPEAVVLPENAAEAAGVIKYAFEREIPVTPRGAGSGLAGGCTPVKGGIVIDMKRMNHIIEIDRGNMTATVESGVVLSQFHKAVERMGLFYPPDPQSMSVCTIGGNVATRAGGPRGVKYGTTGRYVLGLEAVMPDGSLIKSGGKFVKQSVGYDITHLLTGSEGTLALITRVNLQLLPLPPVHRTMVVVCETLDQAAEIVSEIIARGAVPAMLELLVKMAIMVMNNYINPPLPVDAEAYLLMDIDGSDAQVMLDVARIKAICRDMKAREVRVVESEEEAASYWKARSNLYPLIMTVMKKVISEDVTVPRNKIPELIRYIQGISNQVGIGIGIAGHAGDGNVHPTILQSEISPELEEKAKQAIDLIVRKGLDMGGTISGEHGVGIHKKEYLPWEMGTAEIALMQKIKQAFDPRNIMNPGKIWP
jgi:glycolate oxidase